MPLRIALFGQGTFGRDTLDQLRQRGHSVVGVFAPPEGGRPDPLAERAAELGLPLVRRRYYRRRDGTPIAAALEEYKGLDAQLNVLASVQVFLPREITDAPPHRSVCFHPSLLPAYRGGAAMQWQIIDGVDETGVSIFIPDEGADTGPVVVQKGGVSLGPRETTGSLFFDKLHDLGVAALIEAVTLIDKGEARPRPQDEARATHQGLVDDAVAALDLRRPGAELERLVRGCDPQPGAFLRCRGQTLRLYDVEFRAADVDDADAGRVVSVEPAGALVVALRGGHLSVGRVRADAGKEAAAAFAERAGLAAGDRLDSGAPL